MLRNGVIVNTDGSNLPLTSTIDTAAAEKVEYIPLEYAQKKINKLVTDYTTLKSHYDEHISQLNDFHMKANAGMKDYYENFIKDLKRKALEHLTIVKTEKEGMEARLTEELRSKDAAIENLRDVIANKSNEYTESLKKIKMQSALEAEELRRALIKEQDSLVARYQSALLVKDVFSAVELDRLKADKQSRIREIVRDYEGRISRSVLDSSERINELTSEFAQNQVTRQECSGILQGLLFSIESDYAQDISKEFDDYFSSFRAKEMLYKADMATKLRELSVSLEETRRSEEAALADLSREQQLQLEASEALSKHAEEALAWTEERSALGLAAASEAAAAAGLQTRLAEEERRWQEDRSALAESVQREAAEASREHRELTCKLVDSYEARVRALELQLLHGSAMAQSAHAIEDGVHRIAVRTTLHALRSEHDALTESLVRSYEEKISALRASLRAGEEATEQMRGLETDVQGLRRDAADMRAASLLGLSPVRVEDAPSESPGVVSESVLGIQKALTVAAQKENATLRDKVAALERRVEDMSMRRAQLTAASTRRISQASLVGLGEAETLKGEETQGQGAAATTTAAAAAAAAAESIEEAVPGAMGEEESAQLIEELEEEVYGLQVELARVEAENADNASERASLHAQLDEMIKEKRTDVVARFEEDVRVLRSELLQSRESQATLKEERARGELKTKELKERCEKAEGELRDRDERELALLSPVEEKTQLKTTVSKQRDDIIMKSKAATAGWDAAAAADKRLDVDVDRAYQRGLVEADNRHSFAMTALNEAIEKKENRITELLVSIAASEKSKKQLEAQLIEAKEHAAQGVGRMFGGFNEDGELEVSHAELQDARDALDSAQEEVVEMATRIEGLQAALERANKMVELYEKLVVMSKASATSEAPAAGSTAGGGSDVRDVISAVKTAVIEGTKLWRRGARDSCFDLYIKVAKESFDKLTKSQFAGSPFVVLFKEGLDPIVASTRTGTSKDKDKGAVGLRKILDKLLVDCEEAKANSAKEGRASIGLTSGPVESAVSSAQMQVLESELAALSEERAGGEQLEGKDTASSILRRARAAEAAVDELKLQLAELIKSGVTRAGASSGGAAAPASQTEGKTSLRSRASAGVGVSPMEFKKLQKKAKDLEEQLARGGGVDKKALEAIEKKYTKQIKDAETATKKASKSLEDRLAKLTTEHAGAAEKIEGLTAEVSLYKSKVKDMTALMAEMESLKAKASQLAELKEQLDLQVQQYAVLSEQFKKENALRKKYKNELEDLKGAIRVYARCRPMAGYELEKGCQTVVRFTDDTSLRVSGSRGEKDFEFDAAFNWNSTQEEVFEDTRRLVESCLDGFNVCVFAYGQTGSGKTHTMTGSPALPGLTPRAVAEVFSLIAQKKHAKCTVSTYFIELYNDNLVDLFWILDNAKTKKKGGQPEDPPKLDIRLDAKNMVFIRNAVVKDVGSPEELMDLFNKGNAERHTGATKMNAASSRSHSVFAIMVETVDSVTKKTITGKLSLVDLAGSERADKTGASAERLKEAQNINKSLSALGDVIAALSEGEKFIPYRNNKLTQLMQDSLGGNAKTLMFVNFSPADYNADETTTSLQYATRVKKIVNNASKQAESEEVTRLKNIIRKLQSGVAVAPDELEMPPSKIDPVPVIAAAEDPDAKDTDA